ncbi:unnamed protein product [Amoebophrya sp. A25]|nr:unnamed protein product [Amoebophrya sp. A25]|eukprot:GSA25T00017483001.1
MYGHCLEVRPVKVSDLLGAMSASPEPSSVPKAGTDETNEGHVEDEVLAPPLDLDANLGYGLFVKAGTTDKAYSDEEHALLPSEAKNDDTSRMKKDLAFAPGDAIHCSMILEKDIQVGDEAKTMHSIQIGECDNWASDGSLLRFLQHSYDPNCAFRIMEDVTTSRNSRGSGTSTNGQGDEQIQNACTNPPKSPRGPSEERPTRGCMVLVARRHIRADKEVLTVNYNSFEYGKLSEPFRCAVSGKYVNGFAAASDSEKCFLIECGLAFEHILKMHEEDIKE